MRLAIVIDVDGDIMYVPEGKVFPNFPETKVFDKVEDAQIEQETQQYPDEVNEIQKASKDLREAYDERNKATTDAERKAADDLADSEFDH